MSVRIPYDPELPCPAQFSALRHIIIFTEDKDQDVLDSEMMAGILQAAVGEPLSKILDHFPIEVISNSKVPSEIAQLKTTDSYARYLLTEMLEPIERINLSLYAYMLFGLSKRCVRSFQNEKTMKKGILVLAYDSGNDSFPTSITAIKPSSKVSEPSSGENKKWWEFWK